MAARNIAELVVAHFRKHQRDLPWRRTTDAYSIWVSEIMLQQTRVQTVIPYYERCLHQQPLYQKLSIGGSFPVAERAAQEVLSLPVHPALAQSDLEAIAAAVNGARALSGARHG